MSAPITGELVDDIGSAGVVVVAQPGPRISPVDASPQADRA